MARRPAEQSITRTHVSGPEVTRTLPAPARLDTGPGPAELSTTETLEESDYLSRIDEATPVGQNIYLT